MKTITMDYDTYESELESARRNGKVYGFMLAADYIRGDYKSLYAGIEFEYAKQLIDNAIKEKIYEVEN